MAFKKKEGQLGTDLRIMGAAYAENGGIAAKFNQTVPVSFDREKEAEFRKRDIAYRNYFRLRPGKYRLKLAVTDESNTLGSMEQSIEVPSLPEQGIAVSSLSWAEETSQLPASVQNLRTELLNRGDPLLYPGIQIEPCVDNRVPVTSPVTVLFRIYNVAGRDLIAAPRLLGDNGEKFELSPNGLKEVASACGPDGGGCRAAAAVRECAAREIPACNRCDRHRLIANRYPPDRPRIHPVIYTSHRLHGFHRSSGQSVAEHALSPLFAALREFVRFKGEARSKPLPG